MNFYTKFARYFLPSLCRGWQIIHGRLSHWGSRVFGWAIMGDVGGDNESEAGTDDGIAQQRQGLDDLSEVIVINELLSYCVFHYNNSSVDSIKRVVVDFYHPTEISEAKRILWNSSSQEIIGPRCLRRNPNANGKNLDDIFTALQVLDEQSETIPTFAAVKLDWVPRYAPKEIDMTSMILRINDLERKCASLDKQVANNSDTIQTVMDAQMQSNSYASAMKRGPDNAQLQPRNSSTTLAPLQEHWIRMSHLALELVILDHHVFRARPPHRPQEQTPSLPLTLSRSQPQQLQLEHPTQRPLVATLGPRMIMAMACSDRRTKFDANEREREEK